MMVHSSAIGVVLAEETVRLLRKLENNGKMMGIDGRMVFQPRVLTQDGAEKSPMESTYRG